MRVTFYIRYHLLWAALGAAAAVVVLKWFAHTAGWEFISVNPLFSGIVAADVFLMGFLLSGVWSDYKESEKLPGELASSIEALIDEAISIRDRKDSAMGSTLLSALYQLSHTIELWFRGKENTNQLMEQLAHVNELFFGLDSLIPANYVVRMKQEHAQIRRVIRRIRTIRATQFVPAGYLIAQTTTTLLLIGLILAKIEPFYESVFFVGVIAFLVTFMILLIQDLDNPFKYKSAGLTEDVSLYPVQEVTDRLRKLSEGTITA